MGRDRIRSTSFWEMKRALSAAMRLSPCAGRCDPRQPYPGAACVARATPLPLAKNGRPVRGVPDASRVVVPSRTLAQLMDGMHQTAAQQNCPERLSGFLQPRCGRPRPTRLTGNEEIHGGYLRAAAKANKTQARGKQINGAWQAGLATASHRPLRIAWARLPMRLSLSCFVTNMADLENEDDYECNQRDQG